MLNEKKKIIEIHNDNDDTLYYTYIIIIYKYILTYINIFIILLLLLIILVTWKDKNAKSEYFPKWISSKSPQYQARKHFQICFPAIRMWLFLVWQKKKETKWNFIHVWKSQRNYLNYNLISLSYIYILYIFFINFIKPLFWKSTNTTK